MPLIVVAVLTLPTFLLVLAQFEDWMTPILNSLLHEQKHEVCARCSLARVAGRSRRAIRGQRSQEEEITSRPACSCTHSIAAQRAHGGYQGSVEHRARLDGWLSGGSSFRLVS